MPVRRTRTVPGPALLTMIALCGALALPATPAVAQPPSGPGTRTDSTVADSTLVDSTATDSTATEATGAKSTAADSALAPDASRAGRTPIFGAPPEAAPPRPLRTKTRRGGPYTVVADRLEGGRSPVEDEIITLIGNVTLSREGTVVMSQQGRYVKQEGAIYLTGGVRAVDGKTTITSREAVYNETSDFLSLSGDVVVRDGDLILTGDFGSYDQTTGRAELWSRVKGRERGRTLVTDQVIYFRDDELAQARGNVTARDSVEALTLTAGAVDYDRRREVAHATDHPKLIQAPRDGKGATVLEGDTITVFTRERLASALGHVRVERDSLRAEAGRAYFDDNAQRGLLLDEPRAWNDEVSVTGDSLEVFTRDRTLERLRVRSGGRIDYLAGAGAGAGTSAGERSVLTARQMDVFFSGEDIDSLLAEGDAANEYLGVPRPGRIPETNRTEGQTIRLYFDQEQLERAVVTDGAKGVYRAEIAENDSMALRAEQVEYEAARITFEVPKNRIVLQENARLRYQDIGLRSPEVIFDARKHVLEARGNPILEDRADTLRGRALAYDLEHRKGTVYGARTRYESGWYSGERIRRLGDNVVDVKGASYSTCELEDPHYAFESNRMKIYLKDKVIARPIVFAVKHIPVLAFPFYIFPIRQERHSGLLVPQVQFGFTSRAGGFIRNAGYYWAPNDYTDFTLAADYYPVIPSWLLRGEARYKWLYKLEGQFEGSYSRRLSQTGETSWSLRGNHLQTIDENTSLTAQADFTSSADYLRDPITGNPLANRIDRFLISNLTLNHRRPWASFNLFLSRREDLDTDPITSPLPRLEEFLPQLTVGFPTKTIGRQAQGGRSAFLPFLATTYFTFNARVVNQRTVSTFLRADTSGTFTTIDTTVSRQAYQHRLTLSDNRRALGFITFGPNFRYDQVIYKEDATGKSPSAGATWGLGAGASLTLYGTSRGGAGPVTAFRHVFSPQITYSYQPEFPSLRAQIPVTDSTFVTVNRFPPVGGITLSAFEQSFVSFNVTNRFEAKVRSGDREKTLSNLLTLNIGTAYDFLHEQNGRSTPWQAIRTTLRVQPPGYVTGDISMSQDPVFGRALRQVSASLALRFAGGGAPPALADIPLAGNEAQTRPPTDPLVPWAISASFSYSGGRSGDGPWSHREFSNLVGQIQPTRNWLVNYYNQVDLNERRIVAQEWAVTRQLHCWRAQFVRRFSGGTSDYYFRIGIINRPEIFIDRGTTGIGTVGGLGAVSSIFGQ